MSGPARHIDAEVGLQQRSEKYQGFIILALIFVAAVGAALWYMKTPTAEPLVIDTVSAKTTATVEAPRFLKVYVTGAVLRPGVYSLLDGARVEDAINSAGGMVVDADRAQLNLAAFVLDGQQIDVPAFRKNLSNNLESDGSPGIHQTAKVNINTASVADLDTLPGVGEVTANNIVSYRESHGPFKRIEDLRDLKLLRSASDFGQLKDLITVE
jgi:competence protein ComEA